MPDTAPLIHKVQGSVPGAGAAVAQDEVIGKAPFAGTITRVSLIPEAALVGDNVNNRSFRLVNKGQSGAANVVAATLQTTATNGLTAYDEKDVPLSGTPANLVVAEGDVLAADEIVAGTGAAHSGYELLVEISRA